MPLVHLEWICSPEPTEKNRLRNTAIKTVVSIVMYLLYYYLSLTPAKCQEIFLLSFL